MNVNDQHCISSQLVIEFVELIDLTLLLTLAGSIAEHVFDKANIYVYKCDKLITKIAWKEKVTNEQTELINELVAGKQRPTYFATKLRKYMLKLLCYSYIYIYPNTPQMIYTLYIYIYERHL